MFEIGQVDLTKERQTCEHNGKEDVARLRNFRMSIARTMGIPYYDIDPEWKFKFPWAIRLIKSYSSQFDIWWSDKYLDKIYGDEEFDYQYLRQLFFNAPSQQSYWWRPERVNWEKIGSNLMYSMRYNQIIKYYPDLFNNEDCVMSLISRYNNHIDEWWPKISREYQLKIMKEQGGSLARRGHTDFDVWWDPVEFDRKKHIMKLLEYCDRDIDKWWNQTLMTDGFVKENCYTLIGCAKTKFEEWFKPETFNWKLYSATLPMYFSDKFNLWWDPKKFNYMQKINYKYGSEFNYKWFLEDEVGYEDWIRTKREYSYAKDYLYLQCSDEFETWWSKKYFKPTEITFILLHRHCEKFDKIWKQVDYTLWLLENEEKLEEEIS